MSVYWIDLSEESLIKFIENVRGPLLSSRLPTSIISHNLEGRPRLLIGYGQVSVSGTWVKKIL